ncbi:BTB/POZ domain-containing protein 6 isoform X2 [Anastrepha obliqua]|uniref:BTB/POZ domain-containing protein 6 isoform X2 n=1 Tax=Anastrepha obliqua TaxID=95512 RepID=UPI0024090959|nr:BTB/POZ domain-containing protein 6 isoform X2 [Anastrepha obliqua]
MFTKRMPSSKERRIRLLRDDDDLADCEFLVGDLASEEPRLFRCHKMILATASEVFERMFYSDFVVVGPVRVTDVSAASFERFLRYIYVYEIDAERFLPLKELGELFYLADKYMMQDLTDEIVGHLKRKHNWTLGDVWPMYDLACIHENLPLLLLCYEEITKYAENLFSVGSFYRLNVNHLKRLQLEEYGRRNNLNKTNEPEKFLKLVEAANQLDFNKLSMADLESGPAVSYLFNK